MLNYRNIRYVLYILKEKGLIRYNFFCYNFASMRKNKHTYNVKSICSRSNNPIIFCCYFPENNWYLFFFSGGSMGNPGMKCLTEELNEIMLNMIT